MRERVRCLEGTGTEYVTWSQCRESERERERKRENVWLQRKILYITSFLHERLKKQKSRQIRATNRGLNPGEKYDQAPARLTARLGFRPVLNVYIQWKEREREWEREYRNRVLLYLSD